MDQKALTNKLSKCLNALTMTIESENKMLASGQLSSINQVINKKMLMLQELDQIQYELENLLRAKLIDKKDPAILKLRPLFASLNKANKENDILLRTNIEVSHMLIESYKKNKKENAQNKFGYNNKGQKITPSNLEKYMPPVSLNSKV